MTSDQGPPPDGVEEIERIIKSLDRAFLNWEHEAARRIAALPRKITAKDCLSGVWAQAQRNHAAYSATGSVEDDIRFFALGLTGEAGEVANFVKKRWRDGDGHDEALRKECADVLAYTMMLAAALGMTPADLVAMVAHKQQVFIEKMKARDAQRANEAGGTP